MKFLDGAEGADEVAPDPDVEKPGITAPPVDGAPLRPPKRDAISSVSSISPWLRGIISYVSA